MKNKKIMFILGVLLISISKGVYIKKLFSLLSEGRVSGHSIFTILRLLMVDVVIGFFRAIEQTFNFILSWEGALFVAVILIYLIYRNFLKENTNKDK